jgi:hypothetical protein
MADVYDTKDVVTIYHNNIILNFDNELLYLNKNKFTEEDIHHIQTHKYCPGCDTISRNGFYGRKTTWCRLSRKIAIEMMNNNNDMI